MTELERQKRKAESNRRWRQANIGRVRKMERERRRRWREENREISRQKARDYREVHLDECRERNRSYYHRNRDTMRSQNARWYREHPEKNRLNQKMRRARKSGTADNISPVQWDGILKTYDYRCAYCRSERPLTMDHLMPLSRGGKHCRDNIVPACIRCNCSKGPKTPLEWFLSQ